MRFGGVENAVRPARGERGQRLAEGREPGVGLAYDGFGGRGMMRWQDGQMSVPSVVLRVLYSCGGTFMLQPWHVPETTVTRAGIRRRRTVS